MFDKIKDYFVKKLITNFLRGRLESALEALPASESKTVNAILIELTDIVVDNFPSSADFLAPLLDEMKEHPNMPIAQEGIVREAVDACRKAVEWFARLIKGQSSAEVHAANVDPTKAKVA